MLQQANLVQLKLVHHMLTDCTFNYEPKRYRRCLKTFILVINDHMNRWGHLREMPDKSRLFPTRYMKIRA